jgi:ketosteroid isomerase-like protein
VTEIVFHFINTECTKGTYYKIMNPLEFLAVMAETANKLDLEAHMNLISKDVSVYGVPGFEVIGYDDWFNQCEHEFENKLLKKVSYEGLNILAQTPDRVMFKSLETIEGSDGSVHTSGIEFILQKEEDGQWRVSQERILADDELESDKQRGAL